MAKKKKAKQKSKSVRNPKPDVNQMASRVLGRNHQPEVEPQEIITIISLRITDLARNSRHGSWPSLLETILYTQLDSLNREIMLVENFR
jgi:hypothetical protein